MNHHPQTAIIDGYYSPAEHLGAVKMPLYHSSTYSFDSAEQAAHFFAASQGKEQLTESEHGLIYSRLNSPNLQLAENRLTIYDGGAEAALFESGMAAISATAFSILQPGDCILHTEQLYGGTDHFFRGMLSQWGIQMLHFGPNESASDILARVRAAGLDARIGMIYVETPSNPLNLLFDFEVVSQVKSALQAAGSKAVVVADNTYLGPIFQKPLLLGADVVVYSATKYIGGHSDLLAGAAIGSHERLREIKKIRNSLGNMAGPHTAWLLTRSLETLALRMQAAANNALQVVAHLAKHPKIDQIHFPGFRRQEQLLAKQCTGAGATLALELKGGQTAAFTFLNHLKLIRLAVSLGGTESLATHPPSTTHSNVPEAVRLAFGIQPGLVRLSIGIEQIDDLLSDLDQALAAIE